MIDLKQNFINNLKYYRDTETMPEMFLKGQWNEIINALEKQYPKKPIIRICGNVPECPTCNLYLPKLDFNADPLHCPVCGQRIDWNEEDENRNE